MSDFLYPFLKNEAADVNVLLDDLATSARAKAADSSQAPIGYRRPRADPAGGGSRCDGGALRPGREAVHVRQWWELHRRHLDRCTVLVTTVGTPLPAHALVADSAVLTALGNDVGFDLVFSRQLIAYGAEGDIAVGLSTSGNSRNLLAAFAEARSRRMLTIGLAGYDGGDMGRSDDVQHCFIVASESVHRIQEAQGALAFALWSAVQDRLAAVGAERG